MVRCYRDHLDTVEETKDRVAFEERPHVLAGLLFIAVGIMMAVLSIRGHAVGPGAVVTGILVGLALCVFGSLGLVRTTISASKEPGTLQIRRQLGTVSVSRQYALEDVVRAFERRTRKGNGLRLELVDGRKKNLTLWTEYLSLSSEVAMLNHFIHRGRMDSLEERVIGFAGEWFRRNFCLSSRLSFGLHGVNATPFFEEFETEFKVDLTPLRESWNLHFRSPQGPSIAWLVVLVLSYFVGSSLHGLVQWCPTWIWTIALATASGWLYWRLVAEKSVPITVHDLVDAARAGRWVKAIR
jgi:hypothetical protein